MKFLKKCPQSLKRIFYYSFLVIFCLLGSYKVTFADAIDSLYHELEMVNKAGDRYGVVRVYLEIGRQYFEKEDYQRQVEVLNVATDLLEYKPTSNEKCAIYFDLAKAHQKLNNFEESLALYFEYIESDTSFIKIEKKSEAITQIATIYQNLGDYELAYDNLLKALHIQETMKDSLGIGKSVYAIGRIFSFQENQIHALEKYRKSLEVLQARKNLSAEEVKKNNKSIYDCLAALGSTYEKLGMLNKSLDYNLKSLGLAEELDYIAGKANALTNVASVLMVQKKYEDAKNYLTRSLTLKKELNDKLGQVVTLNTMAQMQIESGFPEVAISSLEKGYTLSKEIGSRSRLVDIYDLYARAYQDLEQYQESSAYLRSFIDLRDSLISEATLREMGNRKKRYDVEKRENKIHQLKIENELLEKENEIDSLYGYIWTATAIFLAIVLVLIVNRYRVQRKSNSLLSEKNKEIYQKNKELQKFNDLSNKINKLLEEKNIQIEDQNKRLEESNEDLRHFATVASHDLKEPLRMINAYTNILNKNYAKLFDKSAKEFMGFILDGVSRMESLLNGLLDYSRVSISDNDTKMLNIQDVVDLALGNLRFSIDSSKADIKINTGRFPKIRGNQVQLIQLFQNLIGNGIKFHGGQKPQITLDCRRKGMHYIFTIKDNGIGIKESDKKRIFEMFSRLHTKEEYDGTGIGLATCKKIVERHGGEIWVESEPGQGSTFFFTLPMVKKAEELAV